jgi:DNA-directed RNA polymerase specialized sigma24 family protein
MYVDNKELFSEIMDFKKTSEMSERLGEMLLSVADNFVTKGSFSGYTWKDDMVAEAVLTCVKYLKNFNPQKTENAFAYVTQICRNSFITFIKKQNKHYEVKDQLCSAIERRDETLFESENGLDYTLLK